MTNTNKSQSRPTMLGAFEKTLLPSNIELEKAVLGACLVDKGSAARVIAFCKGHAIFHNKTNSQIWKIILDLEDKRMPIDLLTVHETSKKLKLKIEIGALIDIANMVTSGANTEGHCLLLYELYMRRQAILSAHALVSKAHDISEDIFETYDSTLSKLRFLDPSEIFETATVLDDVIQGAKEPRRKKLSGDFVREGELALFFGDEGSGKSMFSFQLGAAVAEGKAMFDIAGFECELDKGIKTIIFDFELSRQNLAERYYNPLDHRFNEFSTNFIRKSLKLDRMDGSTSSARIVDSIVSHIENEKPGFVIIDNITYITDEITDNTVAKKIMQKLLALTRTNFPLAILVIGHTPKRDKTQPIESKHFAGGKALSNYCTSQFAIVKSLKDTGIKYVKQLKTRSQMIAFDSDNVIDFEVSIDPTSHVKLLHVGYSMEDEHIRYMSNSEKNEQIEQMIEELHNQNYSLAKIASEIKRTLGETLSRTTIHRRVIALKNKPIEQI